MNQDHHDQSEPVKTPYRLQVLVTGATGFVGRSLVQRLYEAEPNLVKTVVRRETSLVPAGVEKRLIGDLAADTDWRAALRGVEAVVHLAARVHIMRDTADNPLREFRRTNVEGTLNLARQAAQMGVRRFIFLSSVKVNGEGQVAIWKRPETEPQAARTGRLDAPDVYRETDTPAPQDAYGVSKHEAEQGLRLLAAATGMELVIIRPPLVYGPGVRANFQLLMRAIAKGIPLPLGASNNGRSLVGLDNLVDFIRTCLAHAAAANQTFLVSDGDDVSTRELIDRIARVMGRPARLVPVPAPILLAGATLCGKRLAAQRLLGSLRVDISKARQVLGWRPPFGMEEELKRTVSFWQSGADVPQ